MCSAGVRTAFGQDSNNFSICSTTGKLLLEFIQVITIVIVSIAPITECHTSQDVAYNTQVAQHAATASLSSRERSTLYKM